jgi:PAS domain S-box-containing protein
MFLAELFVMWFLGRLGMRWGFSGALVDALLLTMLVLPILYFTALQPVSRLAASLATAEADARFRIVVETTSDGILIADRTGRIQYANPAALDMLGYSAGELDGADATMLVPEDLRQRYREGMRRLVETGEGRVVERGSIEVEAQAKDGRRIPVELAITDPLPSEGGPLIALVRDLRSRKRLHLYEALLPTCSVCGLVRDDTGVERGQGRWGSLEVYVQAQSSTRFSHTFCPVCVVDYRRKHGLAAPGGLSRSAS